MARLSDIRRGAVAKASVISAKIKVIESRHETK